MGERPRDEVFDALVEALEWNPEEITPSQRGPLNRAVKEMRQVGATPEEVKRRAKVYADRFPGTAMTPMSLAKWWPDLGRPTRWRDLDRDQQKAWRAANPYGERPS